jgi:hypothetical protein
VEKQSVLHMLSVCVCVCVCVCVVALGTQHAMSMRRIIMSSVACLTLPLPPKQHDFRIERTMCVDFL